MSEQKMNIINTKETAPELLFIITESAINPILAYLGKQPFEEVNPLFINIQKGMSPFPTLNPKEEKKEKKENKQEKIQTDIKPSELTPEVN